MVTSKTQRDYSMYHKADHPGLHISFALIFKFMYGRDFTSTNKLWCKSCFSYDELLPASTTCHHTAPDQSS